MHVDFGCLFNYLPFLYAGENILVHSETGEVMHVDFGCLFDQGLTLAKPEMVPFRLTQNIIDAFGVSGQEGVFRRCCEITLEVWA